MDSSLRWRRLIAQQTSHFWCSNKNRPELVYSSEDAKHSSKWRRMHWIYSTHIASAQLTGRWASTEVQNVVQGNSRAVVLFGSANIALSFETCELICIHNKWGMLVTPVEIPHVTCIATAALTNKYSEHGSSRNTHIQAYHNNNNNNISSCIASTTPTIRLPGRALVKLCRRV
jgi:hypothetical protein